jgi:hypothetical protein
MCGITPLEVGVCRVIEPQFQTIESRLRFARRTTADRMAEHRKPDRRRVCLCEAGLRKGASL